MSRSYWLDDEAWAAIEPHLPRNQLGARRVDDQRVISGILHVLKTGCRRHDGWIRPLHDDIQPLQSLVRQVEPHPCCPRCQGCACAVGVDRLQLRENAPLRRWRKRGGRRRRPSARPVARRPDHKIHAVTDLPGRPAILRLTEGNISDVTMAGSLMDAAGRVRCLIAEKGYNANALRRRLFAESADVVIPRRSNRKVPIDYDPVHYKRRWRIEATFCRVKDFRSIATRYEKARFPLGCALATLVAFWV